MSSPSHPSLLPLLALLLAGAASLPAFAAGEDPEMDRKYRVTVLGEGYVSLRDTESGRRVVGTSFLDLRVERRASIGNGELSAGFHARAFFNSSEFANGRTPSFASILRIIETYAEYLPDGADGIHVVRAAVGTNWVAFGYGAEERASFASFPLASSLSTAGIGFAPNATVTYLNRELGFTIDGSVFSPQENEDSIELDNLGYSVRIRQGIAITTHLKAEVMASYANLYSPTRQERENYLAAGAKVSANLGREVKLEGLAEYFRRNATNPEALREASGWLAMLRVSKGRASFGIRQSRVSNASGTTSEWTATGRYTATRPNSRVKADLLLEVGRRTSLSNPGTRPLNQLTVGVIVSPGAKRKKR